jgi:hypothetical protein
MCQGATKLTACNIAINATPKGDVIFCDFMSPERAAIDAGNNLMTNAETIKPRRHEGAPLSIAS